MSFLLSDTFIQKRYHLKIISVLILPFVVEMGVGSNMSQIHRGCLPGQLPPRPGSSAIVSNVKELEEALDNANRNGHFTILLKDGTYQLKQQIFVKADHVTIRSLSGDRKNVVVRGLGMTGTVPHIFEVTGKNFTAADLTIGEVKYHGIQIHGEKDADNPIIHNLRITDTGQQMIKISYASRIETGSDNGVIEWCEFEYSAGTGPGYYIGGIDAHHARNWIVRNNLFRNIRSPEKALAEHAVHFWSESSDTLVEKNVIINCDRGIGFGLGNSGHHDGLIRNNMIYTTRDVGIGLENSGNTKVYNNTIYSPDYGNSIEYRFSKSKGISIINNLTSARIAARNGGRADLSNNITDAKASWFEQAAEGDLHLAEAIESVVDKGLFLPEVSEDIDCESRPRNGAMDIGADEWILPQ